MLALTKLHGLLFFLIWNYGRGESSESSTISAELNWTDSFRLIHSKSNLDLKRDYGFGNGGLI